MVLNFKQLNLKMNVAPTSDPYLELMTFWITKLDLKSGFYFSFDSTRRRIKKVYEFHDGAYEFNESI